MLGFRVPRIFPGVPLFGFPFYSLYYLFVWIFFEVLKGADLLGCACPNLYIFPMQYLPLMPTSKGNAWNLCNMDLTSNLAVSAVRDVA